MASWEVMGLGDVMLCRKGKMYNSDTKTESLFFVRKGGIFVLPNLSRGGRRKRKGTTLLFVLVSFFLFMFDSCLPQRFPIKGLVIASTLFKRKRQKRKFEEP